MVARREVEQDEAALWAAFTRDIAPLHGKRGKLRSVDRQGRKAALPDMSGEQPAPAIPAPTPSVAVSARSPVAASRVPPSHATRIDIGKRLPGLDTTSWRALVSGKMRVQRRLDLHGHIAQDAFARLHGFLLACSAEGVRCVEVVTGLGSGREGGVIRRELPHWLARGDLRPLILAVVHTHARNQGAVRILLRGRAERRPTR
ncbi:Smr/MutS family protein [Acidomonas methanolica]|uniref:DNA mismatch repair protein Smr/MutS2 n=1 Tax=Acidomonas methanolica NBRC 104435 TaxID=1231351 RepID=A0A023D413_ACIMT|nr:Smr/MutS family protein [Acidomonas methanolica]MBU2653706.1 Smr/MutS family protein [Acidomonas methanolica]GAJ28872.1 DNA mismatch repair protein Smr/MutS2 [Acidomonas methanolica NBRC 104435]GEK98076.1 hypothetical protein AME01nite_05750 [Acidomonas methanolica NBRC 104435]